MLHHDNFQLPKEPQVLCDEYGSPLRLLFSSYGIAATVAVLVAFTGVGLWASLLVFWLGGAATVFALALIATARKPNSARTDQTVAGVGAIYSPPDRAVDVASAPIVTSIFNGGG